MSEALGVRQTIAISAVATLIPIVVIWVFFRRRLTVPTDISVRAVIRKA